MTEQLIEFGLAIFSALMIAGGIYWKGRVDKDNEITIEQAEVAQDAKERLEEIKSIDNDADYIERVRNAER